MYPRYLNAPLLLLLWQVAPVDVVRDDGGRLRVSVAGGAGEYAFQNYDPVPGGGCYGFPGRSSRTEARDYESRGVSLIVWAKNTIRILTAAGSVKDDTGERRGAFGAAQAVLEKEKFGVGLGLASFGGQERIVEPSASARLGPLDGLSLRADYRQPEAGMGLIGGPRVGIGFNQGTRRRGNFFVGIATTPVPDGAKRVGGFVELGLPLGFLDRKAGISVRRFMSGVYHGNQERRIFSLGIGGWVQP
jgi:hypothetical protein